MQQADDIPDRGIWLLRASRLEALLDPLLALLDAHPPASVLAPQTVIVAHPGMRQWLPGAIARRRGTSGIVANLDVVLPGAWLDALAQVALSESGGAAVHPFRREILRWRIHDALGALDDGRVRAYLQGRDAERRRFQLADRLARMFTQYLVYRPDWLDAWAAGRDPTGDAGFLVPLWQRLRAAIGQPHRGERLARLVAAIERADASDDTPLHVFGLSHLAPAELAVLRAVAKRRLVVFHVPDPCREFWAGLPDERARLHELARSEPESVDAEAAFLQLTHPLLAAWGRIGQHFLMLLEDSEMAVDIRHHLDAPEAAVEPANRLEWLQEGIRRAQPGLPLPARIADDASVARADASLRVHACHTRLRELEVLRDALLFQLRENPRLKPSDMVVMAPDIAAYAPLLPAVFGEPGRAGGALPYHLADVPVASADPLLRAFVRLLDLPRSRLTAPEVADLLALPPVARRFGLDEGDLSTIARWLRETRVAWGLDGSFRERFGVPPIEAQTLAWGMDRLLAGYAMGQDAATPQAVALPDGEAVLPLDGVSGTQAAALGTLAAALAEFARWSALGGRTLRAGSWARELEERIVATLRIEGGDRTARAAMDTLLKAIHAIATEPKASGLDPPLAFEVVREFLLQRLSAVPERQRFLMGGATFCGMVPQRAIPFAVVAVIGLDDGTFPRADEGAGIDPIVKHRRMGDRDTRSDDRWLFLQILMSARHALHLSYIGSDVRDGKPRNPAAPLAELIAFLDPDPERLPDDGSDRPADRARAIARRPWFVRHPLQPSDARYRDGSDPALFAFRGDGVGDDAPDEASPPQAHASPAGLPAASVGQVAPLREVLAFYRDPAKDFLSRRLLLRLDAFEDDRLRESESLDAGFERIDRVGRRVFLDAAATSDGVVPTDPPDWLRLGGLLPPGRPGEGAWRDEAARVSFLLEAARSHALFANGLPPALATPIALAVGGWRIEGELARVHEGGGARWIFDVFPGKKEDALDFRQRIGLFLEWALLRLDDAEGLRRARLLALCDEAKSPWQEAINAWDEAFVVATPPRRGHLLDDLRRRVVALLDLWWALRSDPRWYFPGTSWAATKAKTDAKADRVAAAWDGYRGSGERNHEPGYARLLAGDARFERGTDERARLETVAGELFAAIDLRIGEASTP